MPKSVEGMQASLRSGGKENAVQYCQEWKKELELESRVLQEKYKKGEIDTKLYNQKRFSLNQRTADLNGCVTAMNKKFG